MLPDFPLIIADESVDGRIVQALTVSGYSVFAVAKECAGISDSEVIQLALSKGAFIITEDKDFGDELIYKKSSKNTGSLLLRLMDVPIEVRITVVLQVIDTNRDTLQNAFSVLTSKKLRVRKYHEL